MDDMAALRLALEVQRFNPNHAPPGPAGGQFTSAGQGGQQQAKGSRAQRKAVLLKQARADRHEAALLGRELANDEAQLRAQATSAHHAGQRAAGRQARGTAKPGTAAQHRAQQKSHAGAAGHLHRQGQRHRAHHHGRAAHHHANAAALAQRITVLKARIKTLLTAAAHAEAQAKKL